MCCKALIILIGKHIPHCITVNCPSLDLIFILTW